MYNFGEINGKRGIDIKQRVTVTKGKIGTPTGPKIPISPSLVKFYQIENTVLAVMGIEKISRL